MDRTTRLYVLAADLLILIAVLCGVKWGGLASGWADAAAGNLLGSVIPKGAWVNPTPTQISP